MHQLPKLNLERRVSEAEWQTRLDLAACYRLAAHYGWDDLIYGHVSARIPDTDHYLINGFGLLFEEVTASNLVKIDLEGRILDDSPLTINPAGFTIHSAVHQARHEIQCVMHLHTKDSIAVASLHEGLLPLCQHAMFPLSSLAYHDYEGLAVNTAEKQRLQADLGNCAYLLLRNHGALTVGQSIGEAFMRMHDLQRACEIQLQIQSSGQPAKPVAQAIVDDIARQARIVHSGSTGGRIAWPAMYRKAMRLDPGFAE